MGRKRSPSSERGRQRWWNQQVINRRQAADDIRRSKEAEKRGR